MNKYKKRKIKKALASNKIKIILFIIAFFVVSIGSAYSLLNKQFNISGSATIGDNETACGFSAVYSQGSTWTDSSRHYYILNLRINNTTDTTIYNWTGKIKGPNDMILTSNYISSSTIDGYVITFSPQSWNSQINANSYIELQLTISTVETSFDPTWIKINDCTVYTGTGVDPDPDPTPDPAVDLQSLSLSPTSYIASVGETFALTVTKNPTNAGAQLTWTSSDPSVATVSSTGNVQTLSAGTTTITVSSGNISATSTITVQVQESTTAVTFTKTGWWGSEVIQFDIKITNNGTSSITYCSFDLGMPTGTTYTFWSSLTNQGNKIISNNTIAASGSQEFYGQLSIPSGYSSSNYLTPTVTNVYSR